MDLKKQYGDEINRLRTQLVDLEDMREDLDDEEYESLKKESEESLAILQTKLSSLSGTDTTIISNNEQSKLGSDRINHLKNQAANGLHDKFNDLQHKLRLRKIDEKTFYDQGGSIVLELTNSKAELTNDERQVLEYCHKGSESHSAISQGKEVSYDNY
jgi:hypothetical protein